MAPKVIAKNADRTGGVLPVNVATRAQPAKPPAARLKLEVRRLPPGLTLTEFEEAWGDEWKLGNGKVDWRGYRQGKTRAPGSGKVPEQSRCYLHVVDESCLKEFEKRFNEIAHAFGDKAGTHKNPELKHLPPTIGFAPNQRTPLQQPKPRADNRQGTIDQDAEFIAFLEAETQPLAKPPALDTALPDKEKENDKKDGKVKQSTPLIEDLRERKANKAKAAQAKADKDKKQQQTSHQAKDANANADKGPGRGGSGQKPEQTAKDAAKVLNKQAAIKQAQQQQAQQQAKTASPAKSKKQAQAARQPNAAPAGPAANAGPASPAPQRVPPGQRQRGNTDGIKKMVQKDLGLRPKANSAAAQANAASSSAASSTASTASTPAATPPPTAPKAAHAAKAIPAGNQPQTSATKAYLKHANPSQGMTEILIQQALAQHGEMVNVTIDPRKGTAIAVFKSKEGMKKALEAKRVPVAQGAVEVLEFKERGGPGGGSGGGHGGRGGMRGGRGPRPGGRAASNAAAAAAGAGGAAGNGAGAGAAAQGT